MPAPDYPAHSVNTGVSYMQEIEKMMYGFGDHKNPDKETVKLVERTVREQLLLLIDVLTEIAATSDSKKVGINHFLFLLRHNPVKLRRFCTYLQVTDLKKIVDTAEDEKELCEFEGCHTESRKLHNALKYLQFLDPSGYLVSVADPRKPSPILDETLRERNHRIEIMTANMDVQQYLEYAKAKSASFRRNQPLNKFQEWIFKDQRPTDVTLTNHIWAILSYFAYETVAQIVDLAFLVRRDSHTHDHLERNRVPRVAAFNPGLPKSGWTSTDKPLQVNEVIEAIRRFHNTPHLNCSQFGRNLKSSRSWRILGI